MPIEKSAGAIIFRKEPSFAKASEGKRGKIYYLVLKYGWGYWDYVKGHIEKGESLENTIRREAKEEAGIEDLKFVEGFKKWFKYFFKRKNKNIFKIVTFLLAETKTKKIKLSFEHLDYKWLSCEEALKQLTFKNAKEVLRKANKYLMKHIT